ncbi:hypothetical protein QTP88_018909 [Uroleucon formosanum]
MMIIVLIFMVLIEVCTLVLYRQLNHWFILNNLIALLATSKFHYYFVCNLKNVQAPKMCLTNPSRCPPRTTQLSIIAHPPSATTQQRQPNHTQSTSESIRILVAILQ